MVGVFTAAATLDGKRASLAMIGGVESMSATQVGMNQKLSTWLRRFLQARSLGQRAKMLRHLPLRNLRLHIPSITNRTTGLSMGAGVEIMAKRWLISRAAQDELALISHQRTVAAWDRGFLDDLVIPLNGVRRDLIARSDTSLENFRS